MNNKWVFIVNKWVFIVSSFILSACTTTDKPCENITMAAEQVQQCQVLQRQISNAKGKPLIRTELERRYQQDCIDVRFYRDDKQPRACETSEYNKKAEK